MKVAQPRWRLRVARVHAAARLVHPGCARAARKTLSIQ